MSSEPEHSIGGLSTPDITKAQMAGYAATAAGVVASLGLDVSNTWRLAAIVVLVAVLAASHVVSDAVIRQGRARAIGRAGGTIVDTTVDPALDPTPLPRR